MMLSATTAPPPTATPTTSNSSSSNRNSNIPKLSILMEAVELIKDLELFAGVEKTVGKPEEEKEIEENNDNDEDDVDVEEDDDVNEDDDDEVEEEEEDEEQDCDEEDYDDEEDDYQDDEEEDIEVGGSSGLLLNQNQPLVSQTLGDILDTEIFSTDEFQKINNHNNILDYYDKITIGVNTEWIKCACGNLIFGIRYENTAATVGNDDNQKKQKQKEVKKGDEEQPPPKEHDVDNVVTLTWDIFGGTDTDRIHIGDTYFWDILIKDLAPSITSQQWNDYVANVTTAATADTDKDNKSQSLMILEKMITIEEDPPMDEDEEDEDDDNDEESYKPPHADYPDIFKSVLLLVVAKRIIQDIDGIIQGGDDNHDENDEDGASGSASSSSSSSSSNLLSWHVQNSTVPIKTFSLELTGHTWTRPNDGGKMG